MDDWAPQTQQPTNRPREFKWYWHKPTGNLNFWQMTGPDNMNHDQVISQAFGPNFDWNDFQTGYAQGWPGKQPTWKWYGDTTSLPYEADDAVVQHLQKAFPEATGSSLAPRQTNQVSQVAEGSQRLSGPYSEDWIAPTSDPSKPNVLYHSAEENYGLENDSQQGRVPYLYDPNKDELHWGDEQQWHSNLRPSVETYLSRKYPGEYPATSTMIPGAIRHLPGRDKTLNAIYERYMPDVGKEQANAIRSRIEELVGSPILEGEHPDSLMRWYDRPETQDSDDWLPKLGADWAPSLDDRYKNRRPWMLDASNLKNPNPAMWIGNAGEFHPGISTFVTNNDLPDHAWDGVLKGEVDESTSPPTFANYDYRDWKDDNGETVVHPRKSYAISQIERAYYQMMDKPEQRSAAKLSVESGDDWAPVLNYTDASPNAVGHLKFLYSDKLPNKIVHWEPEENWGDPDFLPAHYDTAKSHGLDYEDYTPGIGTIFPDYISLGVHRGNNDHGRALQDTARDYFTKAYPGMPIYWNHGSYSGIDDSSYRSDGYEKLASWKDKYDYRIVDGDNKKTCSTCSAFKAGHCRMFYNAKVDERGYCTEWSEVWAPKTSNDDWKPEIPAYDDGTAELDRRQGRHPWAYVPERGFLFGPEGGSHQQIARYFGYGDRFSTIPFTALGEITHAHRDPWANVYGVRRTQEDVDGMDVRDAALAAFKRGENIAPGNFSDPTEPQHFGSSDWMADSSDSWSGPQSVDKFKVDVPGEAPGIGPIGYIPGEQNTLLRSPCYCDCGSTMPHEWGPTCEHGLHPTMKYEAAALPNQPWNDASWLQRQQKHLDDLTGMYGDHVEIWNPVVPFLVLEDGRTWIGSDSWSHSYDWMIEDAERELNIDYYEMKDSQGSVNFAGGEYQVNWPLHGLHRELEPQIVSSVVSEIEEDRKREWESAQRTSSSVTGSPDHWVWLDGHVMFGGDHHDIADKLTKQIGYDPNHSRYVGNMIARGLQPQGHNVAVGTLKGGYPNIWMSTVDRNAIWDDVARHNMQRTASSTGDGPTYQWPDINPQNPDFADDYYRFSDRTPYLYFPEDDSLYFGNPGMYHDTLRSSVQKHRGMEQGYYDTGAIHGSVYTHPDDPNKRFQEVHRAQWENPWTVYNGTGDPEWEESNQMPEDKKAYLVKRVGAPFSGKSAVADLTDDELHDYWDNDDWAPRLTKAWPS